MANRAMEAKRLKMKRHRRLAPVKYHAHYIPTGMPPNQLVMQELKERAKGLAFDDEYAEYLSVRADMDRQGQHISEGRREVAAHIKRIQDVAPAMMNVVLMATKLKRVKMFYNEDRTRFILLEENLLTHSCQTSLAYMDRKRCIAAFRSDRVRWVRFSSTSPPA
jgi:hypothetical protein